MYTTLGTYKVSLQKITPPTNLVGTSGVLKATLTWTSATREKGVTWQAEKLVRKEGSAPQGSVDGTTVATITTKDTYATAGYEDTGLDSTKTYYYKVFAIYDNGTEKGSTDVNVTPEELSAGIYYNAALGLMSLSSDGQNWVTIADKNLGATQVYNPGDVLSEANCGKLYQWGNNYGFPYDGTFSKSSTKPNASGYVGNYSNSTFITTTYSDATKDRSSVINNNLRGGSGTISQRRGPCPGGYHIPSNDEIAITRAVANMFWGDISDFLKLPTYRGIEYNGAYSSFPDADHWSVTTVENGTLPGVYNVTIFNGGGGSIHIFKTRGYCIRPFKDEPIIPDGTWQKIIFPTLLTYDEMVALANSDWNAAETELNSYPKQYFNRYMREGKLTNLGSGLYGINVIGGDYLAYNTSSITVHTIPPLTRGDYLA